MSLFFYRFQQHGFHGMSLNLSRRLVANLVKRSLILFAAAILSFLWTAGSDRDAMDPPKNSVEFGPRIAISAVFGVGIIYLVLVLYDGRYGRSAWTLQRSIFAYH